MINNEETQNKINDTNSGSNFFQIIARLSFASVIITITAFFTPGFDTNNIVTIIIATIFLSTMDYLITKFIKISSSTFIKGFIGFILATITLYLIQYLIAGYFISWLSAIIGAFIYGFIDYLLPEK